MTNTLYNIDFMINYVYLLDNSMKPGAQCSRIATKSLHREFKALTHCTKPLENRDDGETHHNRNEYIDALHFRLSQTLPTVLVDRPSMEPAAAIGKLTSASDSG